jgi:hyperosmotically inducible protein
MRRNLGLFVAGLALAVGLTSCRMNETPAAQIKDADITATLKGKLAKDLSPATLTDVSVNVTNGVVTLSGQVKGDDAKRRAEEIAHNIEGVHRVNNEIQIATTP